MTLQTHNPVLEVNALSKRFSDGELQVDVLKNVNLQISAQEKVAIVGASGSGKSTLLHLLGGLDAATSGEVILCGQDLNKVSDNKRGEMRNRYLGFIYQFHHLLPEFTALENVAMPLLVRAIKTGDAKSQAGEMLARVGLSARLQHKPSELSGGERQRVAIARALITQPKVILADEPTGNLDSKTAANVTEIMMELNAELKTAIVLVTHDMGVAAKMNTLYELQDGKLARNS